MSFNRDALTDIGLELQTPYLAVARIATVVGAGLIMDIGIRSMRLLFTITCPTVFRIQFITIITVVEAYPCM